MALAERIGFPGHAIVVMVGRYGPVLAKGVTRPNELAAICGTQAAAGRTVWLEADMRAHSNPTRMMAIGLRRAEYGTHSMRRTRQQ